MITTKEELGREMLKALNPLVNAVEKAYEDAFDKLTVMVWVNPYHKHQEFLRRLEAIPPNLRRLVEAGMSFGLVCAMITSFCDRGGEFVNYLRS